MTSEASEEYHDGNERDVEQKQAEPVAESEALKQNPDIDAADVKVLPGTGGPDDVGDIAVAPEDYNRHG